MLLTGDKCSASKSVVPCDVIKNRGVVFYKTPGR